MHIPTSWAKATGDCQTRDKRTLRFDAWGWGDDDAAANREAASRLERILSRVQRGESLPDQYAYGDRPLREEILETIDDPDGTGPAVLITRNRYGALVLNAAKLLFLDIDLPAETAGQSLKRLFSRGKTDRTEAALIGLKEALLRYGGASFRIYQTAAGFRAIAVDRLYDPASGEAQDLMKATGTDPAFATLCRVQKSFRARLTPKPWRCGCPLPPGQHPRVDEETRRRFAAWLSRYEAAATRFATCRFRDVVGPSAPQGIAEDIVGVHDALTRSTESLPLA